jgi:CIC family chloride channel protein
MAAGMSGVLAGDRAALVSGALATGLIAILASAITDHDLTLVLGPGEELINEVLNEPMLLQIALIGLIAKLIATSTTISSGGSAGLLIPSLFFGTMVASIFSHLTGQPVAPLVAVAMTASLVSLVKVPLSSLIFVVEVFGASYLVPALIAMIISALMAYENSIYRTQKALTEGQELAPGYSLQRLPVPPLFLNKTIRELAIQQQYSVNIIGIVHQDELGHLGPTIVPQPDYTLIEGDELVMVGANDNIKRIWALGQMAADAGQPTETGSANSARTSK